jgi:hypothetical protein
VLDAHRGDEFRELARRCKAELDSRLESIMQPLGAMTKAGVPGRPSARRDRASTRGSLGRRSRWASRCLVGEESDAQLQAHLTLSG